jgi:hypothetical protein
MKRIRLIELDSERIISAFKRRVLDIPHSLSWHLSLYAKKNREKLSRFSDIHRGERCFIIGNGPSLSLMDLSKLKNEITFGTNRIYLLFNKTEFRPTYYVSINELVLSQFREEIANLSMPKFLNWNLRKIYGEKEDIFYVRIRLGIIDRLEGNPLRPISPGGTVTFVAMQLAFFMGFSEVILIGVDHNFAEKGVPNRSEVRMKELDPNHFDPNYFPKGVKWQLPDLTRSEVAYKVARTTFEENGRRIFDATINGKCFVFEKVDWYSLWGE